MDSHTLITGASSGFGKALALELAERKRNLVLVALPSSGVMELAQFIRLHYGVQVEGLEYDLSLTGNCEALYESVKKKGVLVDCLINNAGVLSEGLFETLNHNYLVNQINVNVTAPTLLCRLFLEDLKMTPNASILNVCSMASFFCLPKKQVYGGTKSYLMSFSRSLSKELKPYNILVSVVCPGGLNTTTRLCVQNLKLGWISRSTILNPEVAAGITLDRFFKRHTIIVPGKLNKALRFLDSILPLWFKNKLINRAMENLMATPNIFA
ncbi:SDR family oxidoreductase [Mangrovimonas sp. YM274]|uniref:SDR family NAD(P)-dependent oxidoreductase n=1 Tax=Mangrovimonas sp. YM274 TaxID=3070660 RepID=UPI0027DBF016|nr:SDR family NAD(P)-dependent oxidoreductase [Mangrovimonas sp. YM274]WMI68424.1 SDR family NAD(P)-dependent oxidoreductase [Mangrovimonas sp. YM274]